MNGLYKNLVRFSKAIACFVLLSLIGLSTIHAQMYLGLDVFSGISNLSPKVQRSMLELPHQGEVSISPGRSLGFQIRLSENLFDIGEIAITGGYLQLSSNLYETLQYEGMGLIKNVYHTHHKNHFFDASFGFRYFLLRRAKSELSIEGTIGGAILIDTEWKKTSTKTFALFYESPVTDIEYRKYEGIFLPDYYFITSSISLHYSYTISDLFKLNTGLGFYFYPLLDNRSPSLHFPNWHSMYSFHFSMGAAVRISSPRNLQSVNP